MTLLWYSFIFIIYCPFIKLQVTDPAFDLINQSTDIIEYDHIPQVTVLGILTNDEHIQILNQTSIYSNKDLSISSQSFLIDSNPLLTMSELCRIGNLSHAKIIITGQPPNDGNENDLTLSAIAYVSDFYHIPLITIASRENIFSDSVIKN